jgi:hypothetical protein
MQTLKVIETNYILKKQVGITMCFMQKMVMQQRNNGKKLT